jgi:A118 family predicted phage portal protein
MGIITRIKGWINMIFKGKVKDEFDVESIVSAAVERRIKDCADIYKGNPPWLDEEKNVKTVNFAKSICSETARLATLGIKIQIDGSARGDYLQKVIDKYYFDMRNWVEYAAAYGTIVLKPALDGIECVLPGDYMVTESKDGKITGIVFIDREREGKKYFTRLEYHRFVGDIYWITNKCYVGDSENDLNESVDIEKTPWNELLEEVGIEKMESPLYGVLKMPQANNIDPQSPMTFAVFSEAIEELKDLDIAYSRNSEEIYDSSRTVLMDADRLIPTGGKVNMTAAGFEAARGLMKLPKYVKNVYGDGINSFYQEINPSLNTETRLTGINALLSQIGFKCGFSNGYFVFNEKTGMITATQVESDDRRTIHFIKDVRDKLECCLNELVYAINVFADLYQLAPFGVYEIVYDFGDITYNREEDRARWYGYAASNRIPFWYYLVKFEGMTEEEAKALVEEATPKEPTLFGGEE